MKRRDCFALIVGSGFSGSLLAWILQRHGKDTVIIDRASHPRFAIGESTTPTADFLVRHIAERWGLSDLAPLASYGPWKRHYPELHCGKKRGFTYYGHVPNLPFVDDEAHSHSLMVAASSSDEQSDTHWFRSSVDEWLFRKATESGVQGFESTTLHSALYHKVQNNWECILDEANGERTKVCATWIIDASGGSESIGRWLGNSMDSDWMRTRNGAIYGHFRNVAPFATRVSSYERDQPELFDGDDAAQHHVIKDGWLWALRFDHGVTSLGFVLPSDQLPRSMAPVQRQLFWQSLRETYPSISAWMAEAELLESSGGLHFSKRLSRCNRLPIGEGWISLPTSFGFVDPLHSTGIAHALSGVTRIADVLLARDELAQTKLERYASDVRAELTWLDTLVAICYRGLPSFAHFTGLASFYFAAAIGFERDVVKDPEHWPRGYMLSKDTKLKATAEEMFGRLSKSASPPGSLINTLRDSLASWNDVGFLDPKHRNRIAHSAAAK
jgi:tetracycline 7-halogenase / FADH2 O2-dependent halogenase